MRLRISEKVVGLKLDKFGGGMIGKRKGSGESDGENFRTNAFNLVTEKLAINRLGTLASQKSRVPTWHPATPPPPPITTTVLCCCCDCC